jgi:hypothetical protein
MTTAAIRYGEWLLKNKFSDKPFFAPLREIIARKGTGAQRLLTEYFFLPHLSLQTFGCNFILILLLQTA